MTQFSVLSLRRVSPRWSLLPVRVVVGVGFLLHGAAKLHRGPAKFGVLLQYIGVPFPIPTAWVTTGLELCGGLSLIIGAFVAIACVPLIVTMLVAMFSIHIHYGFSAVNTTGVTAAGPQFGPPGYEISLLYIAALMALALTPTALSVDGWRLRSNSS